MISLADILLARDQRAKRQKELIAEWKLPLISLTINFPGPVKNSTLALKIFDYAKQEIKKNFHQIEFQAEYLHQTGNYAFYLINQPAWEIKKRLIEIEEKHPLGRLFDLDLFNLDHQLVSRIDLNYKERDCLLCSQPAYICIKQQKHNWQDVISKIEMLVRNYENK